MADEAAEDGIRDPGHGSKDGGRSHQNGAQADLGGHTRFGGHGVLDGVVPILLYGKALACHGYLFGCQLSALSFQLDGGDVLIFSLAWP
jgi:hypothetical protein